MMPEEKSFVRNRGSQEMARWQRGDAEVEQLERDGKSLQVSCHIASAAAPPRTAANRSRTVAAVWSAGAAQTAALKISTST